MTEPDQKARRDRTRRSGRRFRKWLLICLALAIVGTAAISLHSFFSDDLEHQAIRLERANRLGYASTGTPLPGTPDLDRLNERLNAHGLALGNAIFMRIFKREFELELWMLRDGTFHRFTTYPICRWSGRLGPKLKEGDRQAPEGFYTVDAKALNPDSRWHRSFNLGYPNAFDQAYGRTGSFLMVHGGCASIGCYAMTDPVIDEIWSIVTAALKNGQKRFQVQIFPFRMSDESLAWRSKSSQIAFWRNLKEGHDLFEANLVPPKVRVCGKKYVFAPGGAVRDGSAPIATKCSAGT